MRGAGAYRRPKGVNQEQLVRQHAALVKRIAYHLMARLPPSVQIDDLVQAGMMGLLEAARNYDAGQGASFETYAGIRIRGSMLDEVRRSNWAPRTLNRRMREIAETMHQIEASEGRDARDSEVAERLGISLDEYHQVLRDASGRQVFGLDDLSAGGENLTEGLVDTFAGPLETLESERLTRQMGEALADLPDRERLVLTLYYYEELNLREIGAVLDVSESRVCQIHGQALIRLRSRMNGRCGSGEKPGGERLSAA